MKPNEKINNYTLICECGKGSFGRVFLAQRDDGKYVAFKIVSLLGDGGERECQAIESYSKCPSCQSLLEIFDFVIQEEEDRFYYTMELADNIHGADSEDYTPCTLEAILKEQKRLNCAQTRELVFHLLEGLRILHDNKLVHRDIKPANIVWINGRPKFGDIGLLANDQSMTFRAGSDGFIPPADSPIPPNSTAVDLYAMTRLIFCCLSGENAKKYMDWELPEDLKNNGQDLLNVMLKSDAELATMDVNDFKALLKPKVAPYMSGRAACLTSIRGLANKTTSLSEINHHSNADFSENDYSASTRTDSTLPQCTLSDLSCLSKLASADAWMGKRELIPNNYRKIAAALATAAPWCIAAHPLVSLALLGAGGVLLSKYLKKK